VLFLTALLCSLSFANPILYFSTIDSWKAVSKWYVGLTEKTHYKLNKDMKRLVARVVRNNKGDKTKIASELYYWVLNNIKHLDSKLLTAFKNF